MFHIKGKSIQAIQGLQMLDSLWLYFLNVSLNPLLTAKLWDLYFAEILKLLWSRKVCQCWTGCCERLRALWNNTGRIISSWMRKKRIQPYCCFHPLKKRNTLNGWGLQVIFFFLWWNRLYSVWYRLSTKQNILFF